MSDQTILECPECASRLFAITRDIPPKAKCTDCAHVYAIDTFAEEAEREAKPKSKRQSAPGRRTRKDNGPQLLAVKPALPLTHAELGTSTANLKLILADGPGALLAAHRQAAALSKQFGEEFEAKWLLQTKWLAGLTLRQRARARFALRWRPRYLACLALTRSTIIAGRAAEVTPPTVRKHRQEDEEFETQCLEAEEHAVQLLHDRAFSLALEGTCEPVFWQGINVGHVRKFDGKLIVEVLRAHLPNTFKSPGQTKVRINAQLGSGSLILIGEAERAELVALRQEALTDIAAKRALALPPITHDVEASHM